MIEVLIVVLLGTVILSSAFQLLMGNQRMYTVSAAKSENMNALRAGTDILFNELREVSAGEGDIINIDDDSITVRAAGSFGVVCATNLGSSQLTVMSIAGTFSDSDSISYLADNDPLANSDDVFKTADVTAVSSTTCPAGDSAQLLTLSGTFGAPPDSVVEGSPVRAFTAHTYGAFTYGGEYYLGRRTGSADAVIMAGPLAETMPITFTYFDSTGTAETSAASVALIKVVIRTLSDVIDSQGRAVGDTTLVEVQIRN